MNTRSRSIVLLATATLAITTFTGCENASQRRSAATEGSKSAQLASAGENAKEAARDLNAYLYSQREDFMMAWSAEMVALELEIDKLQAKVDSSTGQTRIDAAERLQGLRVESAKRDDIISNIGKATEDTWELVKSGAMKSHEALKGAVASTSDWIVENTPGS